MRHLTPGSRTSDLVTRVVSEEESKTPLAERTPLLPSTTKITYVSLSSVPPSPPSSEPPSRPPSPSSSRSQTPPTPLPVLQTALLFILQLADPLSLTLFHPFLPNLVRGLGVTHGDENRTGYFVGLLHSAGFATQILTVFHWSHLSDHVGRKPVLMIGCFGIALSLFSFGLSTSYWGFLFSRLLNGALSTGNALVKATVAEYTDASNIAQAFAYMSIARSVGNTLGPLLGGALAPRSSTSGSGDMEPIGGESITDRLGDAGFWKSHPYFLACAIPALYALVAMALTGVYLKETVPNAKPLWRFIRLRSRRFSSNHDRSHTRLDRQDGNAKVLREASESLLPSPSSSSLDLASEAENDRPQPLKTLIKYPPVMIATTNYALISFLDISFRTLQPIFLSAPMSDSLSSSTGFGYSSQTIGVALSLVGLAIGILQFLIFPPLHRRVGPRPIFLVAMAAAVPMFALFPLMEYVHSQFGAGHWVVGLLVGVQMLLLVVLNVGYCSIYIYIASSSPNRASIGAATGIGQMAVCVMRTIGPSLASSLYSITRESQKHGGWIGSGGLVWVVLCAASLMGLGAGWRLPVKMWVRERD